MKCLVTGATGFVGSWLTKLLIDKKHDVRVLCRDVSKAPEHVEAFHGDICNPNSLTKAVSGVDVVYHLAGFVGYSKKHLKTMKEVNVQGTHNIINACIHARIQRLVHISSVAAIGASFTPKRLNENSPFLIENLNLGYFQTKKQAEDLVKQYVKSGKLDAVILNPATIYGAGDMIKPSRKIQLQVAKGYFPFYPPGGVNIIDIESVVEAIYNATTKGQKGQRYILSGQNILIKDLFQIITQAVGKKPIFIPISQSCLKILGMIGDQFEKRGQDFFITSEIAQISILFHWFDASKAQSELNLKPQNAQKAITNSIHWAVQNKLISTKIPRSHKSY